MLKSVFALAMAGVVVSACGQRPADVPETDRTTPQASTSENETVQVAGSDPDEPSEAEIRQADSHTHGEAVLAFALDGAVLSVEFETPVFNLTGFEHAPQTEDQQARVNDVRAALISPVDLFAINPAAACTVSSVPGAINLFSDPEHDHDEAGSDHDDHDHHTDHDDHEDEIEEPHHDHDAEHSDHQDIIVYYEFTCAQPDELSDITVTMFSAFPNLTDLDVLYLGPGIQTAAALTPSRTSFTIQP